MAHPQTEEAGDVRAPATVADAAAEFENYLFGGEEADEGDETTADDGEEDSDLELDGDEPDGEEDEEQDDEGEPEKAIAAPVSLNAEEKAQYEQLPPEAQQFVTALETRRNLQVQEATTKASEAQRAAEARAAAADAQAKQTYALQLAEVVRAVAPEPPNPELARQNPAAYIAAKAEYDAAHAHHEQFVKHVESVAAQADTEAHQAFIAERDRELMQIPEIANPETRQAFLDTAFSVAADLGYDKAELAEGMTARDVKALALFAEMKAKAEKYDAAMARQMQRVRAGKGRTNKPGAASARPPKGKQDWQRVKSAASKEAKAEAFADWLGI